MLYLDHEELMSLEEKEDGDYTPGSSIAPDYPSWYRDWLMRDIEYQPDAEGRKDFEKRPPALGFSSKMIDDIERYPNTKMVTTSQIRRFTNTIKRKMLRNLISCNDCKTLSDLVLILREELSNGVPSPVPSWYTYSTVTMGPRRIGYYACDNRGCYKTETVDKTFSKCGQCSIPKYCSRDCQLSDWSQRHKQVCKDAKKSHEQTKNVGKMLQKLSDMSLTGQWSEDSDLASLLQGAKTNDAVKERRKYLKKEKKR